MTTELLTLPVVRLMIDHGVRGLCLRPYPGHPLGCPNFGKGRRCPPYAPMVEDVFDLTEGRGMWLIVARYRIDEHVARMLGAHPGWSQRQASCCLYWQGALRKVLRADVRKFRERRPWLIAEETPEALGVNVTAMMKEAGLELEWPPRFWVAKVTLVGWRKREV